jgi:phospholipid/cholesterol/gamma-HCH transport system substrate-binding protein
MKQNIRKNIRPAVAIVVLGVIAAFVASYIFAQQKIRVPLVSAKPMKIEVALDNAQAVTPGQGQSVQVAGVRIGRIAAVKLEEGVALTTLEIEPKFDDLVHRDAKALLRPRTGLKDMYIQILPGSPDAPLVEEGDRIPLQNTATDVDLDEIIATLDARTRDYVTMLASGAGRGLRKRGGTLAEVFRRYGVTARDLALVNRAVGQEQAALRRVVGSLAELNRELAKRPDDLSQLVDSASATFNAFASEDDALRDTVSELPDTLRRATTTLQKVRPFAEELGPASRALRPTVRALDRTNRRLVPFARSNEPVVRRQLRPFAREARPLVRDLRPAAVDLEATFPELRRTARVLNRFLNMLAHNPGGRQAPGAANREEGYLFWLAWTAHQTINLFNVDDANGPLRPVFLTGTCGTLTTIATVQPALEFGLNLTPVLASVCGNPSTPSVDLQKIIDDLVPSDVEGLLPQDQLPRELRKK